MTKCTKKQIDDWCAKTMKEKAEIFEKLADECGPGFQRDTYLEYAKKYREMQS